MKVLIVGSSGRAHAMAWKLAKSPFVTTIYTAPGNAGTAAEPKTQNVNIQHTDTQKLLDFAKKNKVDLTYVANENALAMGIVDDFKKARVPIFGPTKKAATVETSKSYCKEFLTRHHIPSPKYAVFTDAASAKKYVKAEGVPIVIKADGPANSRGVVIAQDLKTADHAIDNIFNKESTQNNQKVVIEEFVKGEEISYLVMIDGEHVLPFSSVRDHKTLHDNDEGVITAGMGSYSPSSLMTPELDAKIMQQIVIPTLNGFKAEKTPYQGFLYIGLIVLPNGDLRVLEFNCRLGDPMAQAVLMRLDDDLLKLMLAAVEKRLDEVITKWDPRPVVCVVMSCDGYPDNPNKTEMPISGLPKVSIPELKVFHAGTKLAENGDVLTTGGRILTVAAMGDTFAEAQIRAYDLVKNIKWKHLHYRTDIAKRAVERKG